MRTCHVSTPLPHRFARTSALWLGCPVAGQNQRFGSDGAVGDQVVEVVALGRGVLTHREVIDDEDQGAGVFAHALTDGAIGMSASQVGEHPGAFHEADVAAAAGNLVTKCLCHMGFPDTNWPVEDHGLAGVEPTQRGQVAQHRSGQFGADGEVEVFEGVGLFEAGTADPTSQGGGVAAGDLVFAEHLQEFQVSEFPVVGLGQPGIEGVEHPGEFEGLQCGAQAGIVNGHDNAPVVDVVAAERDRGGEVQAVRSVSKASGPRSIAGGTGALRAGWSSPCSVPATRMPLTVRYRGSPTARARAHAASRRASP